eukprot:c7734_g1_i1.p1 GENE.c7734_g1_i1~~c7734_g1_i1.p1  ORF type:complete len:386 (-),score=147.12 c7734_g1_i1:29-1186(-)
MAKQPGELDQFLDEWVKEIQEKNQNDNFRDVKKSLLNEGYDALLIESAILYFQGTQYEETGDTNRAIESYKRAFKLNPDLNEVDVHKISSKLFEDKEKIIKHQNLNELNESEPKQPMSSSSSLHPNKRNQITQHQTVQVNSNFQLETDTFLSRSSFPSVQKNHSSTIDELFIGNLAPEMILTIFSKLDPVSLDTCGVVCSSWHILSREQNLWKNLCHELWGAEAEVFISDFTSWRKMYLSKPHIHFDGVYANKTVYVRSGLSEWGTSYDPVYVCKYYRYLRFFKNGDVVCLVTPTEPKVIFSKYKQNIQNAPNSVKGKYSIENNSVLINHPLCKDTAHLTLSMGKGNQKTRQSLKWISFHTVDSSGDRLDFPFEREGPFYFIRII